MGSTISSFYKSSKQLNSDPHASIANILTAGSSPRPREYWLSILSTGLQVLFIFVSHTEKSKLLRDSNIKALYILRNGTQRPHIYQNILKHSSVSGLGLQEMSDSELSIFPLKLAPPAHGRQRLGDTEFKTSLTYIGKLFQKQMKGLRS